MNNVWVREDEVEVLLVPFKNRALMHLAASRGGLRGFRFTLAPYISDAGVGFSLILGRYYLDLSLFSKV